MSAVHLLSAQGTLVFCEKISTEGKALIPIESVMVPPGGRSVGIIYTPENAFAEPVSMRLEVAHLKGHSFKVFDEQEFQTDEGKENLSFYYKIEKAGDYRFRLIDKDKKILAEEILSASPETSEPDAVNENPGSVNVFPDEPYHIYFIDDAGFNSEFSFSASRGRLKMKIEGSKFNSETFIVDIWKSENGVYGKFIRSEEVGKTGTEKDGFSMIIQFPTSGEYKVNLYDRQNNLITSAFVSLR
ncbi:MAG: hypothetical protein DWQ44_04005 [Bacteroidetes bacterium]|nr:MAG: hypothetical protein DWQ39_11900 [Bacteroidota bacterium]REK35474.1 MAG: hypothetical protein DWQ44_04005 [Bacteroidota bacterium]REK46842.1 MAG: hypothetical protein DWQ48_13885 [Bacteroidota bacterium]